MTKIPNLWQKGLCLAIFVFFSTYQIYLTFNRSRDSYPFSPYKMFSKNWSDKIVMERIRFENPSNEMIFPWDVLNIPFFQANQLCFTIFLDLKDENAKKLFCELPQMKSLKVYREDVRYTQSNQKMHQEIIKKDLVHECP